MIEISYDNVMNALNKGINSTSICPTQQVADYLFERAIGLWYVKGFSLVKRKERAIEYGSGDDKVCIRFKSLSFLENDNWRGFHGVFFIHPDFYNMDRVRLNDREFEALERLDQHNSRYLEQWHN